MKLKSALAGIILLFGSVAKAQDGPSYEDTVQFIQEKMNTQWVDGNIFRQYFIEMERCAFSLVRSATGEYASFDAFLIDLNNMDPSRIEVNTVFRQHQVQVSSRSGAQGIPLFVILHRGRDWRGMTGQNCETGVQRDFYRHPSISGLISVAEPDRVCYSQSHIEGNRVPHVMMGNMITPHNDAPRVARAMSHLVRICGGREELF